MGRKPTQTLIPLFSAMPLSEPMTTYCELDPEEHIPMNAFFKFNNCFHEKTIENITFKKVVTLFQYQWVWLIVGKVFSYNLIQGMMHIYMC